MCNEIFCIKKLPKMGAIFSQCPVCFSVQKIKLLQKKNLPVAVFFIYLFLNVLNSFRGAGDRITARFFGGGTLQNYKSAL